MTTAFDGADPSPGAERSDSRVEQHHQLLARLVDLVRGAPPADSTADQQAWRERIGRQLGSLVGVLKDHFAAEEAPGGLFDRIRAQVPGSETALAELVEQHGLLYRWAEGMIRVFQEERGSPRVLREELRSFVNALRHHEARESGLEEAFAAALGEAAGEAAEEATSEEG
jgi:hypothetical protein